MRIPDPIVFRKFIPARVTITATPLALETFIAMAVVSRLSLLCTETSSDDKSPGGAMVDDAFSEILPDIFVSLRRTLFES